VSPALLLPAEAAAAEARAALAAGRRHLAHLEQAVATAGERSRAEVGTEAVHSMRCGAAPAVGVLRPQHLPPRRVVICRSVGQSAPLKVQLCCKAAPHKLVKVQVAGILTLRGALLVQSQQRRPSGAGWQYGSHEPAMHGQQQRWDCEPGQRGPLVL
jgi:hypothetical protein